MLLYEKKDNEGVKHLFGTMGNVPSAEDNRAIYKDNEGNVYAEGEINYDTRFRDDGHGGMTREEDDAPVTVWIEDTMVIPKGVAPVGPTVVSVAWETAPTKTQYNVGETINLAGAVIKATYSDESVVDITNNNKCVFVPAKTQALATTDTNITVKFGGKQASTPITVVDVPVVLTKIEFTTAPSKTTYTAGEAINLAGAVVTATYSNSTTAVVTDSCSFEPANGTIATTSMTKITATYEGKTAEVAITVEEPAVPLYFYWGASATVPTSVEGLNKEVVTKAQLLADGYSITKQIETNDSYAVFALSNDLQVVEKAVADPTQGEYDNVVDAETATDHIFYVDLQTTGTFNYKVTFKAKA